MRPDVLIVESTYGVSVHNSREEREARFTSTVDDIVSRGGKCLIPVFALGRAQELLLILDEYWQNKKDIQEVTFFYLVMSPVYVTLLRRCIFCFQIHLLNGREYF